MKTIILAAGKSTRMKSRLVKHLHKLLDRPIIDYVISAAGDSEIIVVTGCQGEEVKKALPEGIMTVEQKEQLGTGHAVMSAADFIGEHDDVLVLCGDTPLIRSETIQKLRDFHRESGNGATGLSTNMEDPSGYGRIVRCNGAFERIVEQKDLSPEQQNIHEINTGIFMYKGGVLLSALKLLKNDNAQGEYYLTDVMEIVMNLGHHADMLPHEDWREFIGINNRIQLAEAASLLKKRINDRHMLNGVTIMEPGAVTIGADVEIGEDTIVYPGAILEGKTKIGRDCIIGPNSRIVDSIIGDGVQMQYSVITESQVGEYTAIGPYAYLRPHSVVGAHCKVGDFVEIKNAVIGDYTKASHLTYIGDADVGSCVNFGCGTVVVNYDGDNKFRTVVEDNAFIGCNTNLVAPVTVKEGAYTAAGSTITKDIPEKTLGIARARQVNKPGWKKK